MNVSDYKPNVLIPLWIGRVGIQQLDRMPERPVLIQPQGSSGVLRGQLVSFQATTARVQAADPLLLWQSTPMQIRFRFGERIYELTGLSRETFDDHSFNLEFDAPSREFLFQHGKELIDAGLLESAPSQPSLEELLAARPLKTLAPYVSTQERLTRKDLTRFRYDAPPGGIERRKHLRHEVQQDAQVAFVSTTILMNCQLIEISLGGCRIYTEQIMHYDIGTPCELRFFKYGQNYRLPAHIQVKTHAQLAGLQFDGLSQRILKRLEEFFADLKGGHE